MSSLLREACLIDGEWVVSARSTTICDPASGEAIGRVPELGGPEAQLAVDAAARALPAWSARTAKDRAEILKRLHALILGHHEDLAVLITAEQGKPLSEARGEISYAAGFVEWFAEEGKRVYGETIPSPSGDKRLFVIKQPVGVVAAITPWNFPAAMVTRKIAPALAAGCTVVLKPAPQTPFTALALAFLAQQAGVPAGVFNVITGNAEAIGKVLTASPVVRKLSFTGSTGVGIRLYADCAPTVKKLSLELGGNAPFIVFDDADIPAAVQGAIASKYRNAGQTCVCANRIFVQRPVYEKFAAALVAATRALKVGNGRHAGVDVGPLINEAAVKKVEHHIADAVAKGGRIACGGARHALGGSFFEPTVLTGITVDMIVTQDETFGPVAPLIPFDNDDDAIRMANDTSVGLAGYFYARDVGRVWRAAEALETGIVGVNTGIISTEVAPFGGVKASGLGREGSRHGIEDYLETKYICLGL
jgi:succinate-semialdehyde dehydrogenase/glutarate-semialdehyde dehydrogenase